MPRLVTGAQCWCGGAEIVVSGAPPVYYCADSKFHDPKATGKPDKITRLYVAGPMSGYPECNYPLFNEVAGKLRSYGYEVVNPAEFGEPARCHYTDLIRADLKAMLDCHAVATLEGWWESVGARNEVNVAGVLKMPVRPWAEWSRDFDNN